MSIPNLPVDFKDDILATTNQKRKYNLIQNDDGTVSFEDATEYQQTGSDFGAGQINSTNDAINKAYSERILNLEEVELVTEPGYFVDALAVKEVFTKLNGNLKIEKIDLRTGDQLNKDYTIPLPEGYYFYNTALLSFQVVLGGAMRDGINNNLIATAHSANYRVINSGALNAEAHVLICKYR